MLRRIGIALQNDPAAEAFCQPAKAAVEEHEWVSIRLRCGGRHHNIQRGGTTGRRSCWARGRALRLVSALRSRIPGRSLFRALRHTVLAQFFGHGPEKLGHAPCLGNATAGLVGWIAAEHL
jgi:hypothetical protein